MRILRRIIIMLALAANGGTTAFANSSELPDTLKVNNDKSVQLKEVVVESVRRKDIAEGIAFFPEKRDKRFATDAVSLLEMMALTELPYNPATKQVTDAGGAPVVYFIDGQQASPKELRSLNPKDVDRIEYLPMPTNASFGGKQNVVNFIMKRYVSGGFSKIIANQDLTGKSGNYSVNSKLAYKEMTYDVYLGGTYRNDNHYGTHGENTFKDIVYKGEEYGSISENIDGRNQTLRKRTLGAMLKATWRHKGVNLSATGGWNWERMPEFTGHTATVYSPDVLKSSYYDSNSSSLGINPYLKISLNLALPYQQSLMVLVNGQYAYHKGENIYSPQNLDAILNSSRNRRWSALIMASYSKRFNPANSLNISLIGSRGWNKTHYGGSYDGLSRYKEAHLELSATYSHTFSPGTLISASAGATCDRKSYVGNVYVQWLPSVSISFDKKWSKKSGFKLSTDVFSVGYFGDVLNDVILRSTELTWKKGNCNLRNRIWWQSVMSNTWNPSSTFSVTGRMIYTVVFNQDNPVWDRIDGYDGVVTTTVDDATSHRLTVGPLMTLKLLRKRLVLTGSFGYDYWRLTGRYKRDRSFLSGNLSATWYGKHWYAGASVVPPAENMQNSSITKVYTNWIYSFKFGYAYKNLNLRFSATNPGASRMSKIRWIDTQYYSQRVKTYSDFSANVFTLQLTYTLSYGKKVSKSVSSPSGMLGSGAMMPE